MIELIYLCVCCFILMQAENLKVSDYAVSLEGSSLYTLVISSICLSFGLVTWAKSYLVHRFSCNCSARLPF